MKNVTGRVITAEPISLSKAATLLSGFASSDNGASRDVSAYLRRASAAFTGLKSFHREIKSKEIKSKETKPSSDARRERNVTGEERKGRKKEKKKKKSDEEIGTEDRKSKKKRKSDEEMGSEERKSKKKRKLKGIDA